MNVRLAQVVAPALLSMALAVLIACAPAATSTPQPTLDADAIRTDAARAIFGAQTASALVAQRGTETAQAAAATATPTPGEDVIGVATEDLNIRNGPGINYERVGMLIAGTRIQLTGVSEDGQWYRHSEGWSAGEFLDITGDTAKLTVVTVEPPAATATLVATVARSPTCGNTIPATAAETIKVRSGPGTGFPVTGTLTRGEVITITARSSDGNWLRFERGWASAFFIRLEPGCGRVPTVSVRAAAGTRTPTRAN
jgi:N-acetylmuramoyl-L-alanine amidase